MKFGIIGAGMIGRFHARAIDAMTDGELVGVANHNPTRAAAFAQEFGVRAYPSIAALLADSEIEIVSIATPSGAHFEPALAAIQAGKHVIVEKPLEVTTARIDPLIAAARRQGVTLAAILNRRFHPAMDAAKAAADAGRLGRLTSASAYVKWYRDQAYYDSAAWRGTWALDGGGALMNQAIHTVDALLYLAGPVKAVQAHTSCLAHTGIEVEDMAVALLEFTSGARGVIEASTCSWSEKGHPARVQLTGTAGSVFLADESVEVWSFQNETPADDALRARLGPGATAAGLGANDPTAIGFAQHQRNFEEVVAAIRAGREPATSAAEARRSVELIQGIYASARAGGAKIELPGV